LKAKVVSVAAQFDRIKSVGPVQFWELADIHGLQIHRSPFVRFVLFVRSPYGGVSYRCRSGRGNRLFTRVVIVDVGLG